MWNMFIPSFWKNTAAGEENYKKALEVLDKADDREQVLMCDIDLHDVKKVRSSLDYLSLRRPEQYI